MAHLVCSGATLQCSFGAAPSTLVVTPEKKVLVGGMPAATIMDHKPIVNIATFGMCSSITNPQVASATAAAQGVLTPQPCVPVIPAPWTPGSPTVALGNIPALNSTSKCMCSWLGVITITAPGQVTVQVP